jgi:hypothetical protein
MKRELAQDLNYLLGACVGLSEHMTHLVKDHGGEAEFSRHRSTIAQLLAALETQVFRPVLTEYPDLDPDSPLHHGKSGMLYPGGGILVQRDQDRAEFELGDPRPNDLLASARLPPEGMPPWEGLLVKDGPADKELAAVVMYFLRITSGALIHIVWLLLRHGSQEEFIKYRMSVGYILSEIQDQILCHIDDKYPDLDTSSPSYMGDRAIHEGRLYREQPAQEPTSDAEAEDSLAPQKVTGKGTPMDQDVATHVTYIARSCAGLLRHTIWLVKQQGTEEELANYRKHMAVAIDELETRLLAPLYAEHPDLDPQSPTYRAPTEAERMENFLPADEAYPEEPGPGAGTT